MVDGQVGGKRGLRRAAGEDRHALALGAEVRAGYAALEGGEPVADCLAEGVEAPVAGAEGRRRGGGRAQTEPAQKSEWVIVLGRFGVDRLTTAYST